ncbi:MAG: hypothetical protein U1C49_02320 [Candidatus Andersenbacteria bacterium]|nr:hypothetical protein [bacterium]MDZ4225663.1 hypothetical protein [Candidatus Andersenbacteria bacterium]
MTGLFSSSPPPSSSDDNIEEYAHRKARAIIDQASQEAAKSVTHIQSFTKELEDKLTTVVDSLSQTIQKNSLAQMNDVISQHRQELDAALDAAKTKTIEEFDAFLNQSTTHVSSLTKVAIDKINEAHHGFAEALEHLKTMAADTSSKLHQQTDAEAYKALEAFRGNLSASAKTVNVQVGDYLDKMEQNITVSTTALQKKLAEDILAIHQRYQKDIDTKKSHVLNQITTQLNDTIPRLIEQTFSRKLPSKEQEQIIKDILENISRSNLWT